MDRELYEKCVEACDEFVLMSRRYTEKFIKKAELQKTLDDTNLRYLRAVTGNMLVLKEFLENLDDPQRGDDLTHVEGVTKYISKQNDRIKIGSELQRAHKVYEKADVELEKMALRVHEKQREVLSLCTKLGVLQAHKER